MVHIRTIEDLKNITKNDIELIFYDNFNQKIIIPIPIPNSVQTLIFSDSFNQKVIIPTFLLHKKLNKVEVGVCPLV